MKFKLPERSVIIQTLFCLAWIAAVLVLQALTGNRERDPCTTIVGVRDARGELMRHCESEYDAGQNGIDPAPAQ